MSDVRKVFITKEVSDKLNMTPAYLIRTAKTIGLTNAEFREAGKRNYLFSESAVQKLLQYFNGDKKK